MKAGPLILVLALPLVPENVGAAVIERAGDIGSVVVPAGAALGALFVHDAQGLGQFAKAYGSAMAVVYVLKPMRVDAKRHYTNDVIAGAAIGVGANLVFTRPRGHASIGVGLGSRAGSVTIAW